jgi:hypothetical protein
MDIVIGADGEPAAVRPRTSAPGSAFAACWQSWWPNCPPARAGGGPCALRGVVARRMWQAVRPYRAGFITPMAAVAGAVAQELVAAYHGRACAAPGSTMAATSPCT